MTEVQYREIALRSLFDNDVAEQVAKGTAQLSRSQFVKGFAALVANKDQINTLLNATADIEKAAVQPEVDATTRILQEKYGKK
ncbi:hypothetical protein K7459_12805 [Pseudomonas fluorescens]|uniref:Uncharacterized protein n=1 Tax=Pseudomonas fluorescens (strain Pf0-1) TaxID=205922 RepID=Q3KAH3_PSEPF|nr:hypothetical protein [Pseudomonas fluorescens]ABA75231.2 hypothetical protein Pfl01_3493 [Pseudomonas fluorescens Pf0-1]MBY9024546.1 hypothetical protein [Pseudomonas fluorescens]MBY9030939.1 hypothetical protein [Pseudomonas fluorescens]MBY9036942.1 hypothetical protein [Pseudomonas fluorescens]MBY9043048.1 hypothetical protein [Pseudomonas fluorescens]